LAFLIGQRELGGFIINFHGFSVFIRSMNLYSRRKFFASLRLLAIVLAVVALTAVTIHAQRRAPHKLRATAVLEVTTDAAGIVTTGGFPGTVLEEGHFLSATPV